MHILLSTYACDPGGESEAANGWGWATHLTERGIRVHVLTAERHRESIETELRLRPRPDLSVSFVETRSPFIPKTIGGWHYLAWQFAAVKTAEALHAREPFDLIHHVTYGSIHVPSQLWRLGIPTLFGPVGGGQTAPVAMLPYFGDSKRKEILRTYVTRLLPLSPFHRLWLGRMTCIFATNRETCKLAGHLGRQDAILCFDSGLPKTYYAEHPRQFGVGQKPTRLLWIGRMWPRRALPLALDAIAQCMAPVTLTILGDGLPPDQVHRMISARGLEQKVVWRGRVPPADVRLAYADHDGLLFTSLRESCGTQLLEALAAGLPVITLDLHGGSLLVPERAGIKVSVTDPRTTATAIAKAIDRFATSSAEEKNAMSQAALEAALLLSWPARAERAQGVYETILSQNRTRRGPLQLGPV